MLERVHRKLLLICDLVMVDRQPNADLAGMIERYDGLDAAYALGSLSSPSELANADR